MSPDCSSKVVVTGLGMVTPLGNNSAEVLRRIQAGDSAAGVPTRFDASAFACSVCAEITDFEPQRYVSEPKLVRLMSRDAQLAVAAARLCLQDAGIKPGANCPPESVALFGATGLAGLPLREVAPLIRVSAGEKGGFDLSRFGTAGLKAVSPILSFKILANMPFCFVSINENIQGVNAIYTPWEGEGAQAIEAGIRAVQAGDANCALVGGCDVKTHELAFATLQQLGLFASWTEVGKGVVPAEGAACLMLETEQHALARGARIYARVGAVGLRPRVSGEDVRQAQIRLLSHLGLDRVAAVVSSANGEVGPEQQERSVLDAAGISTGLTIAPKKHAGDLFAAAGLLQVALGASLVESGFERVLVNCFGHGGTQAAFVLEQDQAGKPK